MAPIWMGSSPSLSTLDVRPLPRGLDGEEMRRIYKEGCGKVLELEASECDHPANGRVWIAGTVASFQILAK
ncbi:hypothetical protein NEMBOFW57_003731 [Staphylotrichum longicolle]|uniref:Uncharacterized protein n=1 Tax=Staphylotrichum longicolle TaxID=669026 RepID=A0AAD4F635_9PEZI|nr:hypothetical protein NEMBOFW57_003731 [Staphylotrichum longicolle]